MKRLQVPLSILALLQVLLLNLLAVSPALHERLHGDAHRAGHECAVTMFAHGKVDAATVDVSVVIPTAPIETASQIEFSVFTPAVKNLPPGRAPPPVSSPQV